MPSVNPNPESALACTGPPKLATPLMRIPGPVPACEPGTLDCVRVAYCTRSSFSTRDADRRHQLPCRGVLTVAEVGPLLHRVRHAGRRAADVVGNEVVEEDVADAEPVVRRDVVIDLADGELRLRLGRNVGGLREPQPRGIGRRDRHDARAREVALRILEAAEVERPVLDDRPAVIDGEDVHLGRRLDVGRREERQLHHRLPLEAIARLPMRSDWCPMA